jgi:RNA polymerase-interacting CarD/CdnL/TRCF family regulator
MLPQLELTHKLEMVFERPQAELLAEVITAAYTDLVKTSDFNELKAIVRDLAKAQQRTERRVEELAKAQQETQHEIKLLTRKLGETNSTLGSLGQSVVYARENEAYRMLPGLLA